MTPLSINTLSWPMSQLGEALQALASASGLAAGKRETINLPGAILAADAADPRGSALREWVEAAADFLGFEAEAIEAPYGELETLARGAGPALLIRSTGPFMNDTATNSYPFPESG